MKAIIKLLCSLLLKKLETNVAEVDKDMPNTFKDQEPAVASELLEIKAWKVSDNTLHIRLKVYPISEDDNHDLVAYYDQQKEDNLPNLEESISHMHLNPQREEIHTWKRTAQGWVKEKVNIVLVENKQG